jgi:nitrogen regulatory protein P-II 2
MHAMKLLTIVCEAHAEKAVTALLREAGAHGWTLFEVKGLGAQGSRPADIPDYANIQVEAIVKAEVSAQLLERLEKDYFPCYAMIAYETDVRVLREGKF